MEIRFRSRGGGARCAVVAASLGLLLGGCRAAPEDGPQGGSQLDLLALLPEAEPWCETAELDLGTAAPEPALIGGWGAPSREVDTYLWGAGERSELTLRRADARAFRIRMRGWAHPRLPEGQDVDLSLNNVALPRVRLGSAPQSVEVEVPEGLARPGRNRLVFTYPVVVPTGRYGQLYGPAWDGFRFDGARGSTAPLAPAAPGGALELPAGCGIDFWLEAQGGTSLVVSGVEERGGARLEADAECEGEPASFGGLERSRRGRRERPLRAAGLSVVPCRVTLRAVPGAAGDSAAAVRIGAAGVHGGLPAPEPPRLAAPAAAAGATPQPSFVIYLVDALRADRLGAYGGPPGLTPALDRFAKRAVLFEQARAQSSWTRPAVASLFTGLAPPRHGATDVESRLPDEVVTLAERLRERGYRTGYVTANGNTTEAFGFGQGFDFFRWLHGRTETEKVRWRSVHAAAREFFDSLPAAMPFFLVLHTVETHAPYRPSPKHRARWAPAADRQLGERDTLVLLPGQGPGEAIVRQVGELYAAEVADADEGFADLLQLLAEADRRGRRAPASVLFLSDHGEELFDHGNVEHGRTLYEEQLRIPLLWSLPDGAGESGDAGGAPVPGAGRRVALPIDQIDIAPTLLELAGLPLTPELQGRSFAAFLRGGAPPAPRSSAAWLERLHFRQEAVASSGFKLIRDLQPPSVTAIASEELFDLAADPRERQPLGEAGALRLDSLRAQLRRWRVLIGAPLEAETAAIDDRLRRELQALGYIQ